MEDIMEDMTKKKEKEESILHKDVGEVLKARYKFSVAKLIIIFSIIFIVAFFAGTQTAGVFQLSPKAFFRTQIGPAFRALSCPADTYKCESNILKICNGVTWSTAVNGNCNDGNKTCTVSADAKKGSCENSSSCITKDAKQCSDDTQWQICDGSNWIDDKDCANFNQICGDAFPSCKDSVNECDGINDKFLRCDPNNGSKEIRCGNGQKVIQNCPGGNVCGSSGCESCTANAKRCSTDGDRSPEICNNNGEWVTNPAYPNGCTNGTSCINGGCGNDATQCGPVGRVECVDNNNYRECETGIPPKWGGSQDCRSNNYYDTSDAYHTYRCQKSSGECVDTKTGQVLPSVTPGPSVTPVPGKPTPTRTPEQSKPACQGIDWARCTVKGSGACCDNWGDGDACHDSWKTCEAKCGNDDTQWSSKCGGVAPPPGQGKGCGSGYGAKQGDDCGPGADCCDTNKYGYSMTCVNIVDGTGECKQGGGGTDPNAPPGSNDPCYGGSCEPKASCTAAGFSCFGKGGCDSEFCCCKP